jgi:hypothetical protein
MDISTVLIFFIIICVLILLLCIYKVFTWYKNENIGNRWLEIKREREEYITYPLQRSINKIRFRISVFLFVFIVALLIFYPYSQFSTYRNIIGWIMIGILFVSLMINNWYVSKKWVCPFCNKRLPVKIGKGGASPRSVDICSNCNNKLTID